MEAEFEKNVRELEEALLGKSRRMEDRLPEDYREKYDTLSNFILQSGSAYELGGSDKNSAAILLYSREDIREDSVWISGPLPAPAAEPVPFCAVARFFGAELNDDLFYIVMQNFKKYFQVRGAMVKGSDGEIWIRVGRHAAEDGLSLARLSSVFLARLHTSIPEVTGCRLMFVTERNEEFRRALELREQIRAHGEELRKNVWKNRGFNFEDCTLVGHCGQCADKKLCANIRKMDRVAQANRVEIKELKNEQ